MVLMVPDWADLDTVVQRLAPPVLWPVGPAPLLGHWMDEARRRGASRVTVHCPDRPQAVRAWVEGGAYWSCPVVVLTSLPKEIPEGAEWLDALPGEARPVAPADGAGLARWWFERQQAWLGQRASHALLLDTPHPGGGWTGPRVRIHSSATLKGPFWIGAQARIGPGCEIGPGTLIGPGAVLDATVRTEQATVLADTYVGRNLELRQVIADGGLVIDVKRGCRVEIGEAFIVSSLARREVKVPWVESLVAALLWPVAWTTSLISGANRERVRILAVSLAGHIELSEGRRGSLLARRAGWLALVVRRRMRLVGPLPRQESELAQLPPDVSSLLRSSPPGVFSLADLHGSHAAGQGDELVHALYQLSQPGATRLVWHALPRLVRLVPESSDS